MADVPIRFDVVFTLTSSVNSRFIKTRVVRGLRLDMSHVPGNRLETPAYIEEVPFELDDAFSVRRASIPYCSCSSYVPSTGEMADAIRVFFARCFCFAESSVLTLGTSGNLLGTRPPPTHAWLPTCCDGLSGTLRMY